MDKPQIFPVKKKVIFGWFQSPKYQYPKGISKYKIILNHFQMLINILLYMSGGGGVNNRFDSPLKQKEKKNPLLLE